MCPSGDTVCGGRCTNTQVDGSNCGGCGQVCPSGALCETGSCCIYLEGGPCGDAGAPCCPGMVCGPSSTCCMAPGEACAGVSEGFTCCSGVCTNFVCE
jgi:hypothetical protein